MEEFDSYIVLSATVVFLVLGVFVGPATAISAPELPDGVSVETENGTTLTVNGGVVGGFVTVKCSESETSERYCDKGGSISIGPASVSYDGFNSYEPTEPTGGFGDRFVVMLDGQKIATVQVSSTDSEVGTLVGLLGSAGFGLFGETESTKNSTQEYSIVPSAQPELLR